MQPSRAPRIGSDMTWTPKSTEPILTERQAFEVWFGRTIRNIYEPVIHEPLPDMIIRALAEAKPDR